MSQLDVTPMEDMASAKMPAVPKNISDAITKILSPSANIPFDGLPDKSMERVTPLQDEHVLTFTNGRQFPFAAGISKAYTYNSSGAPALSVLSTPGFNFLPEKDSRYNCMIMLQPTLLSHGWFRLEYFGRLNASDPTAQTIVVTGPIPSTNPQLADLFVVGFGIHGQNGTSGPSAAVNFWQAITNVPRVRKFAARMRVACSSVTIVPNVDSFYDGGTVKQAVWGCEHRYRVEGAALVDPYGTPGEEGAPYYRWDGLQVDSVYSGGTTKPNLIAQDLEAFMSQSHEFTNAPMKDPLTGGAYSIWRTNGEFVDADLCLVDNPLAINFAVSSTISGSKMGNYSYTFQPTRAPVNIISFSNLHSSCALEMTFRQFCEIVPGLGSPINPFSKVTPVVSGFEEMYKAAALMTGRCNPSNANDMGTLWKKVRGFFDDHRHLISSLTARIPEVGVPLAALVEGLPYKQSVKDRKVQMTEHNNRKQSNVDQLTSNMSKVGISVKQKAPPKMVKRKAVALRISKRSAPLRAAKRR